MVEFSNYLGPMDRNYSSPANDDPEFTNDVNVGVEDIGESIFMGVGAQNLNALASKVKSGVKTMEITFSGAGGGSGQQQTPDQYGADKRRALKELAEINELDLKTHAAVNVMGLSGRDQRGNFSAEQRKMSVDEIKRAINFAADAAQGGTVVVHTGEFDRPLYNADWNNQQGNNFMANAEEDKTAVVTVVDDRTGEVVSGAKVGQKVARPKWNKYESDNEYYWNLNDGKSSYIDENGNEVHQGDYIDYQGNKILNPYDEDSSKRRVPKYDFEKKRFETQLVSWDEFEKEAQERSKYTGEKETPEEAYVKATLESQESYARGYALHYSENFSKSVESLEKLKKSYETYKDVESNASEEERWAMQKEAADMASRSTGGLVSPEYKMPSEILKEAIEEMQKSIEHSYEAAASQEQQAREQEERRKHLKSAKEYALEKSYDSYADAGMHAYMRTKQDNLKKPLAVAMENLFPEAYGGHPDEIIDLIKNSREKMAQKLAQKGLDEKKAKEVAQEHIKMTLDTNHLYMWKKYWKNNPNKTIEQNDKDFNKWYLNQIDKFAKNKIIGNVHLTDGYGYQDDHLSPGDGMIPIKDVVKKLQENGYDQKMIVEAGADATVGNSHFDGVSKAWKLFSSPVYGAHHGAFASAQQRNSWQDIGGSYFGRTQSPYFVVGSYVPSEDWSLWSGTQLE